MSFSSTFQHKVSPQECEKKMSFINYQIIASELSAVIILFYLLSAISNPNSPQNSISVFFFKFRDNLLRTDEAYIFLVLHTLIVSSGVEVMKKSKSTSCKLYRIVYAKEIN